MISPILSAISPDTPVSTSSKIIVGKAVNPAIIALMQSINREISPPEAVWATGCNSALLLAENINRISSIPSLSGSLRGRMSTRKRVFGIPNGIIILTNCEAIAVEATLRCSLSTEACWSNSLYEASNWLSNKPICSSKESIARNCSWYWSRIAINSSTVETRCFCRSV